ncbi:ABC multidrug transporter MDR1 [Trichinella spiralis]|uniref:ABC multidrug transporter MDR1 n=1 Tax=Trichinella spiralis TaxID=6334 RepID=A0ABR3KVX6_TRISP
MTKKQLRHQLSFYGVAFALGNVLVPLATLVHMDIKAFPSRPSVPLLITYSIVYQCGITNIPLH